MVTLTAEPNEGKAFGKWKIYDPNHPGDPNYMVKDVDNPTTIVMDGDREVEAVFKCGSSVGYGFPLLMLGALIAGVASRRIRRRR